MSTGAAHDPRLGRLGIAENNDEGSMRLDDELIISHLDNTWRTAPAVHRLLSERGTVADIAYALERLARAGKIEAKHEAAMVPKFRDNARLDSSQAGRSCEVKFYTTTQLGLEEMQLAAGEPLGNRPRFGDLYVRSLGHVAREQPGHRQFSVMPLGRRVGLR